MSVIDARTWLQHLAPEECWDLLASVPVGRLGVLVDSAPEIYPVNFVVDDHAIVFRTDPGEKLHGLDRSPSVCFEVDGIDPESHTGWSVLVKGRAQSVGTAKDIERLLTLPLTFWGVGPKAHWVRVVPAEVTGRRILRPRGARS